MLRKTLSATPKPSCNRQNSVTCMQEKKNEKVFGKPKKIVVSKKPHTIASSHSHDGKCSSTGKLSCKARAASAKYVTRSDLTFFRKPSKKVIFDHCRTCGDTALTNITSDREDEDLLETFSNLSTLVKPSRREKFKEDKSKTSIVQKTKSVEQYYKNENFKNPGQEMRSGNKKESDLLPIKELPEIVKDSSDLYLESEQTSMEDKIKMAVESDRAVSLKKLKEFREKNYFECHSSTTRISSKANVTSLQDHKCKYRFYLNDRLFPVPLNSEPNNAIRCTDCQLPYEGTRGKLSEDNFLNGTIQAKIKLGVEDETQDVTLVLPVQEPLIIREKRADKSKPQDDVVYFGVVKLTPSGHSIFKGNLPQDSLALRYQKGYKEFSGGDRCAYDGIDKGDVIYI